MSPRRVARSVIEKLDRDQSGELDHSEFYNWLAAGVEMSHEQRQKFSKKGHQIIITNSRGPHTIDFAGQTGVKAVKIE